MHIYITVISHTHNIMSSRSGTNQTYQFMMIWYDDRSQVDQPFQKPLDRTTFATHIIIYPCRGPADREASFPKSYIKLF